MSQYIIQEQKKEFERKWYEAGTPGVDFGNDGIWDWHTSSIKQIIQALIEREENRLKECEQCDNREIHDTDPWNQAKQDTITHLKQLLDNLQ